MDSVDRIILNELRRNCRISYGALAQELKITRQAVGKRVTRLIKSGLILGFSIKAGLGLVGAEPLIAVVHTDGTENEEAYALALGSNELISNVGVGMSAIYIALGCYTRMSDIEDLRRLFYELRETKTVKIHPIIPDSKTVGILSKKQKVILGTLLDFPRKSIRVVSDLTGFNQRTVQHHLNDLLESGLVRFSVQWNPSAGSNIGLVFKLTWNEKNTTFEEVESQITRTLSANIYQIELSAIEPSLFLFMICEQIGYIAEIDEALKALPNINSIKTIICKRWLSFSDLASSRLKDMLNES